MTGWQMEVHQYRRQQQYLPQAMRQVFTTVGNYAYTPHRPGPAVPKRGHEYGATHPAVQLCVRGIDT